MEEQRLEYYLSMPEVDLTMYEGDTTITPITFPIYQVHTVDSLLFCVDTGAPHSRIGDKALERISRSSWAYIYPRNRFKRDLKFGDTLVRSIGVVELMLPTCGYKLDIPVILDVVDVEIASLLGPDVLDGNNLLVDNVTNHL